MMSSAECRNMGAALMARASRFADGGLRLEMEATARSWFTLSRVADTQDKQMARLDVGEFLQ